MSAMLLAAAGYYLFPLETMVPSRLALVAAFLASGLASALAAATAPDWVARRLRKSSPRQLLWLNGVLGAIILILTLLLGAKGGQLAVISGTLERLQFAVLVALLVSVLVWITTWAALFAVVGPAWKSAAKILASYVFLFLRLSQTLALIQPSTFPDSASYLNPAFSNIAGFSSIFFSSRPFTVPLAYAFLGKNPILIAWVQSLVSMASWLFLAWRTDRALHRWRVAALAFIAVLGLGLTHLVVVWDWAILSESLSLSLMALSVACLLIYLRHGSGRALIALILVSALWANTRDVNAALVLAAAATLIIWGFSSRNRRLLFLGAVFGVVAAFSIFSGQIADRAYLPTFHTLTYRTLRDAEAPAFFLNRGMPPIEDIESRLGAIDTWPPEFFSWVETDGQGVLIRYLLSNLPGSLWQPFVSVAFPVMESFPNVRAAGYAPILPPLILPEIESAPWTLSWFLVSLLAIAGAFRPLKRARYGIGLLAVGLILSAYPLMILTWHLDAWEPERHLVGPSIQLVLGLLLLFFSALDIKQEPDLPTPPIGT